MNNVPVEKKIENVLLISLDCVRPEALGCYPQQFPLRTRLLQRGGTPEIDRLANAGHRFEQAITHAPFTPAAHASLLTGLIPPRHGVRTLHAARLNEDVTTLPQILSEHGWHSSAVVGAHALSRDYGLTRGFAAYDDDIEHGAANWVLGERRDAPEVTERALTWLQKLKVDEPFFLFVHYFDAHAISLSSLKALRESGGEGNDHASGVMAAANGRIPAAARNTLRPVVRGLRGGADWLRKSSDEALQSSLGWFEAGRRYRSGGRRYMMEQLTNIDREIGRMVRALREAGRLDSTMILILADHGEDFWEHGDRVAHRPFLYDTSLRVPLIIYPRLGPRATIPEQVQLVDILPTVLDVVGVKVDSSADGVSLLPYVNGVPTASERAVYAETIVEELASETEEVVGVVGSRAALRLPAWKLIWDRLSESYELHDLVADPEERENVAAAEQARTTEMVQQLRALAGEMPLTSVASERTVTARLQALGYL